jgi:hypothetical protein
LSDLINQILGCAQDGEANVFKQLLAHNATSLSAGIKTN